MSSVTRRIKMITQPIGGYLNPKIFEKIQLNTDDMLAERENIHPSLVGLVVDYLTRFSLGASAEKAFHISLRGAKNLGEQKEANLILSNIKGLDDKSIVNACKMVGYDVVYRVGPRGYKPVSEINPDIATINNVRALVNRSLKFFETYGPVVMDGFSLKGAYTKLITVGDGDFITKDTLWDFKVSVSSPTKDHTLQLIIYYLMGLRSIHSSAFNSIKYLGIYNPKLSMVYRLSIGDIPNEIINSISKDVIGY
ncbi:MAG: hypothetical protein RBS24_02725 [Bacilli bacterium]|nr:hypothetical protein [Bacilli bacterium]